MIFNRETRCRTSPSDTNGYGVSGIPSDVRAPYTEDFCLILKDEKIDVRAI